MKTDTSLKEIIASSAQIDKSNGYLICESCKGYYKLQKNESPEDFSNCECGGFLIFRESINDLLKVPQILDIYDDVEEEIGDYDEYDELQQIVDFLKIKATERKKFLEDLSQRVESQGELLNEIRHDRFSETVSGNGTVWDILEEKGLDNKINGQKRVIGNIIEHEDRFLSFLHEKRSKNDDISRDMDKSLLIKIGIAAFIIITIASIVLYFII